jgi:hypothetical protein
VTVEAKEDQSSSYFKLMFREMMGDAMSLLQIGAQLNVDGISDEFSKVYGVDKSKIFGGGTEIPAIPPEAQTEAGVGASNMRGVPQAASGKQPQPKPPKVSA